MINNSSNILNGGGSKLGIRLMTVALLVFTGYRSFHFLTTTLPDDAFIVAIFGLVALDLGVLLWEAYFLNGAMSSEQQWVAGLMIVTDLAGVAAAFVGDVLLIRQDVTAPAWLPTVTVFGVIGVTVLNVAAGIAVSVLDPAARIKRAQRGAELARELVRLAIEERKASALVDSAATLAADVAPTAARHITDQLRAQYAVYSSNGNYSSNGKEPPMMMEESKEGGPLAEPKSSR